MTKADVKTILEAIAEEFEAVDQPELARAYRRAAGLVEEIEEGPRRRRRRRMAGPRTQAGAAQPTQAPRRGRPPRNATPQV